MERWTLRVVVLLMLAVGRSAVAQQAAEIAGAEELKQARQALNLTAVADSYVFADEEFPQITLDPRLEELLGPLTVTIRYYDRDHRPVDRAERPGRYGAVVRIESQELTQHRFVTLYRLAEPTNPEGVSQLAGQQWGHVLGTDWPIRQEHVDRFRQTLDALRSSPRNQAAPPEVFAAPSIAVHLAWMAEAPPALAKVEFYNDPSAYDRQWWVTMKRKLYAVEETYPAWSRPLRLAEPAPVLREGTPQEAGMDPAVIAAVREHLEEWVAEAREPLAVCVARRGVVFMQEGHGGMNVDTVVWVPGVTKTLAGTLMMMAVDQDLMALDDVATDFLPPLKDLPARKPMTFRHMFTHTTGMHGHWGDDWHDMEQRVAPMIPHLPVGREFHYPSAAATSLAGKIIELASGEALPQMMRHRLLEPLGMHDSVVTDMGCTLRTSARDLVRLGQMLLNRGAYGHDRFFSPQTFESMLPQPLTGLVEDPETTMSWGIGLVRVGQEILSEDAFGHPVSEGTIFWIDPRHELVIVMTRSQAGHDFQNQHRRMAEIIVAHMADEQGE